MKKKLKILSKLNGKKNNLLKGNKMSGSLTNKLICKL